MTEPWQTGGFGLYVHWPFCEAKCPYCDFNSHVTASVDHARWARALAGEVRRVASFTPGRLLRSIYFGGGTPSLMAPETVRSVIDAARETWIFANDIEITLEANPRSVEIDRFEAFSTAGVNRVSLGVQALRDADLRRLGRLHSAEDAVRALSIARSVFDRVSFDLIYARQDQSLTAWEDELREALTLAADHLSLYQLTIERGTAFWDRARAGGLRGLPDEDLAADLYETTQAICSEAGFPAYEVSNHSARGAESRHNLVYWRGGDYAGVGPGAHGRLTLDGVRHASVGWRAPKEWLDAAEAGCGDRSITPLSVTDWANEYLMMGLRTAEGLDLEFLRSLSSGVAHHEVVREYEDLGLLRVSNGRLAATPAGILVLNRIVAELMAD